MYPYNATPIKGRIILVEGIYDVINLHDKGLTNTMCCFGVNNVTVEKLQLLKMRGVEQIDIFYDPDEAGQVAAEKVIEMCEKEGMKHYNIRIPPELGDAGALSESSVQKLKERLY